MTKTTHKNSHKTKTAVKDQKPIISTGKKIGLTIYFTFIFTLMGVMGLQIWLNGPNGLLSNKGVTTPQQSTEQTTEEEPNNTTQAPNNFSQTNQNTDWTYNYQSQQNTLDNYQNSDVVTTYE